MYNNYHYSGLPNVSMAHWTNLHSQCAAFEVPTCQSVSVLVFEEIIAAMNHRPVTPAQMQSANLQKIQRELVSGLNTRKWFSNAACAHVTILWIIVFVFGIYVFGRRTSIPGDYRRFDS
jgi:hypothetical protein